jgi:uncharacterized protein (DUF58 family)
MPEDPVTEQLLDQETVNRLEQLSIMSRKISTGRLRGERRSRRRGTGSDFADYRNYVAGDDMRFLDWKIYGRLEKLFIKLFLEEEDLRVNILIDTSASMSFGEPEKLLYAKRLAAALGYICLAKMDSLTVRTFGDGLLETYGPKRGKVNSQHYFDFLSAIKPTPNTDLRKSFTSFANMTRSKGIVVIISDFYDLEGYKEALRQLFARNFEVLAIQVFSPEELKPDLQGDIKLMDCEFDASTDISMSKHVMKLYQKTLTAFCNGLKSNIIEHGGYYLLASTETPFERLVFDVLRRRGLIR